MMLLEPFAFGSLSRNGTYDERVERPRCARSQYPDSAWDRTRSRWLAIHASAASSDANGVTTVGWLSGMLTSTPNEPSSKGTTL
jgi:hypothetical protein